MENNRNNYCSTREREEQRNRKSDKGNREQGKGKYCRFGNSGLKYILQTIFKAQELENYGGSVNSNLLLSHLNTA